MAAFIGQMPCLSIEISRGYGLKDFREDIKVFMIKTGVEGENVAFLFTDTQVVEESMLEDINSILNSGEIPNLFPQDELEIVGELAAAGQEQLLARARRVALFRAGRRWACRGAGGYGSGRGRSWPRGPARPGAPGA